MHAISNEPVTGAKTWDATASKNRFLLALWVYPPVSGWAPLSSSVSATMECSAAAQAPVCWASATSPSWSGRTQTRPGTRAETRWLLVNLQVLRADNYGFKNNPKPESHYLKYKQTDKQTNNRWQTTRLSARPANKTTAVSRMFRLRPIQT